MSSGDCETEFTSASIRQLIKDASQKNLFKTGIMLSEQLISSGQYTLGDSLIHAQCHFSSGLPRRCLSTLERNGFLSVDILTAIQHTVNPTLSAVINGNVDSFDFKIDFSVYLCGLLLAAQCLLAIGQYNDCISLLDPIIIHNDNDTLLNVLLIQKQKVFTNSDNATISPLATLYLVIGKCYFAVDNRAKSVVALQMSLKLDWACIESLEFILEHKLMDENARQLFFRANQDKIMKTANSILISYYTTSLCTDEISKSMCKMENSSASAAVDTPGMVVQAEYFFEHRMFADAYKLSKQVYGVDPYDTRALVVYIACLVELHLNVELFYLGHELVISYPKSALTWYAVGCYYRCCSKFDLALSYLHKSIRIDKRFVKSWMLLGHILSSQEENEQAITAYRAAIRLMPGDSVPMLYMAKELIRTNHHSLALQILLMAHNNSSTDSNKNPELLNEIGVAYSSMNDHVVALDYFTLAISAIEKCNFSKQEANKNMHTSTISMHRADDKMEFEIIRNYSVCLRQNKHYDESLLWLNKCLSMFPTDAAIHVDLGLTYHLQRRFIESTAAYHRALALQPNFPLCLELLNLVIQDTPYSCI